MDDRLMRPTLGRIVLYRSRTARYTVPAMIIATVDTIEADGVRAYRESQGARGVPPLTGEDHVHLVVFTPGLPGQRAKAEDFVVQPERGLLGENVAGTYQEWDIPPASLHGVDLTLGSQEPGSWRYPLGR